MKMFNRHFLILLMIHIQSSSSDLGAVYETGRDVWKLYLMVDNATYHGDRYNSFSHCMDQIGIINKQLQKIGNSVNSKNIRNSFEARPYPIMLYKSLDTLEIFTQSINQYYNNFHKIITKRNYYSEELGYFIGSVIPQIEEGIIIVRKKVLEPIESLGQNLIFTIAGYVASEQPNICNSPRIISDVLLELFKMIVMAEMKAHVLSAIARLYVFQNDELMNPLSSETLKMQIGRYVNLFSLNMPVTDAVYLRACEPHNNRWIRDESFYELEGTFQTAIFGYNWRKCSVNTCYDIWNEESDECEAHYYDDRSGCSGHLTECIDLSAIKACVLKSGPRKFHHLNSSENGLLGRSSECPNLNSYIIEDGSGRNSSHSACACNCHGNDNKISLSIMESNVQSNMVITGLRFIRQDRILYIQPREGKLSADGHIRHYSERWIPIPKNISTSQIYPINIANRIFFLDDLRLPSGFVLTGVGFSRVQRLSVIGFAIKILGVPFNSTSGELNSDPNFSLSKQASNNYLGKSLSFEAMSSASVSLPLELSPEDEKYVLLQRSNLRDDFGQSTLPFFDIVPVITNPSVPLGGFGIFHKGTGGYAGFFSLRVYGIEYSKYYTDFQDMYMKHNRLVFNCTECVS